MVRRKDIYIPIKHVSNSASIIDLAGFRKDMVRSGIITYGLYPSEEVSKDVLDLKPAMELKTHIVYIKEVGPERESAITILMSQTRRQRSQQFQLDMQMDIQEHFHPREEF